MKVFLNGKYIDEKKASLSIHDHGFLYGDGVYETLRVYNGHVFVLDSHLKRLKHSADGLKLKLPMSLRKIGQAIHKTAWANGHKEAVVRLTVSRGPGLYGFDPALCDKPTIAIVSKPFSPYPPAFHLKGITASVLSIRRNNPNCLPPHVKSTSCVNGVLAKMESLKLGAKEGIFLTLDGFLSEGTVSNIFIVNNKTLFTPMLDGTLLAGTTREYVCGLARRAKYRVIEKQIRLSELLSAEEAFLTNTTMEVLPITRLIDNSKSQKRKVKVGNGLVGPVTKHLMGLFKSSLRFS